MNPRLHIVNGPRAARRVNLTRPGAAHTWFRISNRAAVQDATSEADVYLMDEIGGWGVTAGEFIDALRAVDAQQINLHINSPGGDVFDGVAIYNALVAHSARITVYVDGLAASAASFIAQAGDEVVMNRGSMMMIHDASGFCFGPATDMRAMADLLDKVSDTIADIYASRTGKPTAGWRAAMLATTWYTAREAVDAGLADRVTDEEDAEATATARAWAMTVFNRRLDGPAVPRAQEDPAPAPAAPVSPVDLPAVGADADRQEEEPAGAEPVADAEDDPDTGEATDDVTDAGCGCDCEACEGCTAAGDSDGDGDEATEDTADQPVEDASADAPAGEDPALTATAADGPLVLGQPTQTPGTGTAPAAPPAPTTDDPWSDLVARLVAPASPRSADDVLASLREALL